MINRLISDEALAEIRSGERKGCHGQAHWFKVAQLGVTIATAEGGDPEVAFLFGMYHDCRRLNDNYDPEHGLRASELVQDHVRRGLLHISPEQLPVLIYACKHHDKGLVEDADVTVSSCWDADRLDLPRVGIQTNPYYLGTDCGKKLAMLQLDYYVGEGYHG